jgi:hypothetical protein
VATVIFDTLKFADTLKAAGVRSTHAEAEARAFAAAMNEISVATKSDIEDIQKDLHKDMQVLKQELIIWLGGITIASATIATGILGYIIRFSH